MGFGDGGARSCSGCEVIEALMASIWSGSAFEENDESEAIAGRGGCVRIGDAGADNGRACGEQGSASSCEGCGRLPMWSSAALRSVFAWS